MFAFCSTVWAANLRIRTSCSSILLPSFLSLRLGPATRCRSTPPSSFPATASPSGLAREVVLLLHKAQTISTILFLRMVGSQNHPGQRLWPVFVTKTGNLQTYGSRLEGLLFFEEHRALFKPWSDWSAREAACKLRLWFTVSKVQPQDTESPPSNFGGGGAGFGFHIKLQESSCQVDQELQGPSKNLLLFAANVALRCFPLVSNLVSALES